ncbi:hypothetical protein RND81_06G146700 [Saponaria officinalis]|uniref:Pectate lyase n=1 Tax=Saponaria officinalis TaxID=3572 RepID=A0AAW1K9X8_SAPOF
MTIHFLLLFLLAILSLLMFIPTSTSPVQDPELIVGQVLKAIDITRYRLSTPSCSASNPIDGCWSCDQNWNNKRQQLADCGIGFGKNAIGGKDGPIYVVTNPKDDPWMPEPGTLRYGVMQDEPLWIIFSQDMVITLKQELIIKSFKTIDGRGAIIRIARGSGITIKHVSNIIIHGIQIHDCQGDGVSIRRSTHIWIDHCFFSNCTDGLIDATHGSTAITISNNYMSHHDKVMLLGHSDSCTQDTGMQVTVAFNRFGEGLIQRMPRCRHGYFHVVSNDYSGWEMYAIGGSAAPTIISQGNRFIAPKSNKEVTKHFGVPHEEWKKWNWTSAGDLLLNGARFTTSGTTSKTSTSNGYGASIKTLSSSVASLTRGAGILDCRTGRRCYPTPFRLV